MNSRMYLLDKIQTLLLLELPAICTKIVGGFFRCRPCKRLFVPLQTEGASETDGTDVSQQRRFRSSLGLTPWNNRPAFLFWPPLRSVT